MLLASTSSVYGASEDMSTKKQPELITKYHFMRQQKTTENMAHSYSHLFNLPITVFRFFTVYGPWELRYAISNLLNYLKGIY